MQRDGNDHIGGREQVRPRPGEPAGEGGRNMVPVGMFKRQNRLAAVFVIAHHRTGTVESRWLGEARRAARIRPRVEFERQTAGRTARAVEKRNRLPTIWTQAPRFAHGLPANDTKW